VLAALDLEPDVGSVADDVRALVPFVPIRVLARADAVETNASESLAGLQFATGAFGAA